jgi:hypothetical protein
VLTRAYSINTLAIPNDMRFHESVSFTELWDSQTPFSSPNSSSPGTGGSTGAAFGWSFGGQHLFSQTDSLGFAYTGNVSAFSTHGALDGSNHRVTLNYAHKFSRRLGLTFVNNGSIYSANYALQNPIQAPGSSIANVNLAASPTLQPYASNSTARLSYNFSGGYFTNVQNGAGLISVAGMQAQGGVNYRYSVRTTVGLYYSYGHNAYAHGFGSSDTNSGGLSYALVLNRSTQIRLRGGIAWTEATDETPVIVSPIVYELFGTPTAIVNQYTKTATGDFSGQLMKDFSRSMAGSLAFVRGVSPGNGQLLTSEQQTFSGSFTIRLQRIYTLQFSAMSESLSAIGQTMTESYHADVAQVAFSRKYRNGIVANFNASYSYYGHTSPFALPYEIHVGSGISWNSSGLKMWPF